MVRTPWARAAARRPGDGGEAGWQELVEGAHRSCLGGWARGRTHAALERRARRRPSSERRKGTPGPSRPAAGSSRARGWGQEALSARRREWERRGGGRVVQWSATAATGGGPEGAEGARQATFPCVPGCRSCQAWRGRQGLRGRAARAPSPAVQAHTGRCPWDAVQVGSGLGNGILPTAFGGPRSGLGGQRHCATAPPCSSAERTYPLRLSTGVALEEIGALHPRSISA